MHVDKKLGACSAFTLVIGVLESLLTRSLGADEFRTGNRGGKTPSTYLQQEQRRLPLQSLSSDHQTRSRKNSVIFDKTSSGKRDCRDCASGRGGRKLEELSAELYIGWDRPSGVLRGQLKGQRENQWLQVAPELQTCLLHDPPGEVPIVVIVTGLEHYEPDMECWWSTNGKQFTDPGMHFQGHECVTTLGKDSDIPEPREQLVVNG
ncbi:hypothetical protein K503DRAFT_844436 [Rhizopogon vinicolor AM-OR11-026]|uniref:Uncharacterized protein n=1 Tax=Rhizopogon vinicolor AM-OR11-026 TaxID=1314800 RepID=A0A1B7MIB9_9AGAM|nr:hypothetical protein K503DRAFT_844436 [Rhizopogon vinicolor AM-OR11-026]